MKIYQVTRKFYYDGEEEEDTAVEYLGSNIRQAFLNFRGVCRDSEEVTHAESLETFKGNLVYITITVREIVSYRDDTTVELLGTKAYRMHEYGSGEMRYENVKK